MLQWRGGGIIFGPVVRSHAYKLQKKVRRLGLMCALSVRLLPAACFHGGPESHLAWMQGSCLQAVCFVQAKASEGRLRVLDTLAMDSHKTVSSQGCMPLPKEQKPVIGWSTPHCL